MTTLEEIRNKLALEFAYKNGQGDVTPMWLHKSDLLESDEHAFIKGFEVGWFLSQNYDWIDPIGWVNKSTMEWVSNEQIIAIIKKTF